MVSDIHNHGNFLWWHTAMNESLAPEFSDRDDVVSEAARDLLLPSNELCRWTGGQMLETFHEEFGHQVMKIKNDPRTEALWDHSCEHEEIRQIVDLDDVEAISPPQPEQISGCHDEECQILEKLPHCSPGFIAPNWEAVDPYPIDHFMGQLSRFAQADNLDAKALIPEG
jgi:hypothetical protein